MKRSSLASIAALSLLPAANAVHAEQVLYGSAWSSIHRGSTSVTSSQAGPISNCTTRVQRDRYCEVPSGDSFQSLLEVEHGQVACVNEVAGTVEGQVSSYVYLFPCEHAASWNGPVESTYGQAASRLIVPFAIHSGTWTMQISGSSEVVYADNQGTTWCRASIESVDGEVRWAFERADVEDGVQPFVGTVELPAGFYVLRIESTSESQVDPLGFGAALGRLTIAANIPPAAPPPCAGDADGDGQVSFPDIAFVLRNWARLCELP